MFPSEVERIRWSVESIDRHVADSRDHQKALLAAATEYRGEALELSSQLVASQERIQELLGRTTAEIQAVGAEVAALAPVMEEGFEAVKGGLADLGALFQWGFDELLCQLSLQRQDLKQILTTLQAPLDTQAKELRLRGLEALRNGWHEEAVRDLLVSEQKNYRDFTVLRAVAAIYVRREHWAEARVYYEKAAKYARPYSPRDAAEAHLGASVACRQQGDIASAYRHSESAVGLSPSLLEAHYDHAVNATCASQSPEQRLLPPVAQLMDEAIAALRKVLWADEEYAVRVDTEPYFDPIRGACNSLLERLRADLEREVAQALASVDAALASAEAVCAKDRFAMIGAPALRARAALGRVQARNSILDYVEVRRQAPLLERYVSYIRDLVQRVDGEMQRAISAYNAARQTVAARHWSRLGSGVETRFGELQRLHGASTIPGYEQLERDAPARATEFYTFAEQRLRAVRAVVERHLGAARAEWTELSSDAGRKSRAAKEAPFGWGLGCLTWLLLSPLIGGLLVSGGTRSGEAGLPAALLGGICVVVLFVVLKGAREAKATEAEARAKSFHKAEVQPLEEMLNWLERRIQACHRRQEFDIPQPVEPFLLEAGE